MKKQYRKQLTLFLDPSEAKAIEQIRKQYNPVQYGLIKSHITLCREDEIADLDKVVDNLQRLTYAPIILTIGSVKRFAEGKGVLIPVSDTNGDFEGLRHAILQNIIAQPRKQEPHITLMHPRNASCTDAIFQQIQQFKIPTTLTFSKINLIEQELGQQWQTLRVFD